MTEPTTPRDDSDDPAKGGRAHKAGALDIRNVIGALLGVYGVILIVLGLVGDTAPEKTGDVNANLWAGLVMLAVGAAFVAWARLRPLRVPGSADH
jgi:hypothetical protein